MSETLETKRPLGRSALMVPRIALGCGNFGGVGSAPEFFGQGLSEDEAFELMDAAWEFGLTHFDTADAYGGGRSERAIGRWIASRGRAERLRQRHVRVELVREVQLDMVRAEPFQAHAQLAGDPFGAQAVVCAGLHRVVGLGRQLRADPA